jgi:hypothetical protein
MAQGALSAGYHAMKAEARKNAKYAAAWRRNGHTFYPFVMESMGGFGPGCHVVLSKIATSLT